MNKTIYIKKGNRKIPYHLYESYIDPKKAHKTAKYYKKKGMKNIIITAEDGFWFPEKRHYLYLDKYIKLW